jgi:hypothetical protein
MRTKSLSAAGTAPPWAGQFLFLPTDLKIKIGESRAVANWTELARHGVLLRAKKNLARSTSPYFTPPTRPAVHED